MMKKIFVLAAAALFVLGMSTSSWAVADFAIGGSVRLDMGWVIGDLGDTNEPGGEDSQTTFFVANPGNGRINFKATVGDVTGFFEFAMGSTDVSTRHIYASWDMGGGHSLLFGHTWSIMAFGFTDQRLNGDDANIGFGCLYFSRVPQLRYTYSGEMFTVKIAAENPDEAFFGPATAALHVTESYIPMFVAEVSHNPLEQLYLQYSGFYNGYELTEIGTLGSPITGDVDVDSFGFAIDGSYDFEMARISFEGWMGENLGVNAAGFDSRPTSTVAAGAPVSNAAGTDVEDVTSWGGFVQLTFRFEPAILNLGAGYQESDVENPGVGFEDDIAQTSFFVNVLYNLTDNFYIQPEISYFDYGDDADENAFGPGDNDLGADIFLGVHFQADF
jgi:hypothetical protein